MSTTFTVNNVSQRYSCPNGKPLKEQLASATPKVLASSTPEALLFGVLGANPLIAAAKLAFADHHPLVFSPDVIWVAITQGFAKHVNLNAEKYRSLFVQHEGKKRLEFWSEYLPGTEALPWDAVITQFSDLVRKEIGNDTHSLVVADFSTTGTVERVVSEAVLLDAMQSYFEYYGGTMCGIPEITLEGTTADWERLHEKVKKLAAYEGMEFWLPQVQQITAQFVEASKGNVDSRFWQSIVKVESMSGGPYINGWIMRFLPYVRGNGEELEVNPILATGFYDSGNGWGGGGLTMSSIPNALSKVPFIWNYMGTEVKHEITAGIIGIESVPGKGLKPTLGWFIR